MGRVLKAIFWGRRVAANKARRAPNQQIINDPDTKRNYSAYATCYMADNVQRKMLQQSDPDGLYGWLQDDVTDTIKLPSVLFLSVVASDAKLEPGRKGVSGLCAFACPCLLAL